MPEIPPSKPTFWTRERKKNALIGSLIAAAAAAVTTAVVAREDRPFCENAAAWDEPQCTCQFEGNMWIEGTEEGSGFCHEKDPRTGQFPPTPEEQREIDAQREEAITPFEDPCDYNNAGTGPRDPENCDHFVP